MTGGPERRHPHEAQRTEPYARPEGEEDGAAGAEEQAAADTAAGAAAADGAAAAAPGGAAEQQQAALDAAMQAAIQQAAAAAAQAAIAQQQARAVAAAQAGQLAQVAAAAAAAGGGAVPGAVPSPLPGLPGFIKVSGQSDPRKVAGKLAHTCRDNPAPAMLTIGSSCINQAVKAIAIARGYLADTQMELTFQTAFREGGTPDRPSVALYLSKHPNSAWQPTPGAVDLAVSASSQAPVIAGALTARCKENAPVCLVGIGVDAVTNAVMAIGHTRLHLEADGKDIRVWPEFVKVLKGAAELNAIKFHVHVEQLPR